MILYVLECVNKLFWLTEINTSIPYGETGILYFNYLKEKLCLGQENGLTTPTPQLMWRQ